MSRYVDELRRTLTEPLGPHLSDERLAEVAAAETAGEDVDALYAMELAHLERCPECAVNYSELVDMTMTAVTSMATTARAVTPQEVLVALLQRDTAEPIDANEAQEIAAALPSLFTKPPTSLEEVDASLATTTFSQKAEAIISATRHNLAVLVAYLGGVAEAVWGRGLEVETAVSERQYRLQFQPTPALTIPTLSSQSTGDEWVLLSRRIGHPRPWHVVVRARRQSILACTLTVRVDRPGLADAAGHAVVVEYGGQIETAITDARGIATFNSLPIAALPTLVLTIDNQAEESPP